MLDPVPHRVDLIDWDSWQAKDPATLLFVIRDGKILLIRKKRGLGAGKINGPGGKLDPGETPRDCAIRECQEELLITPKNVEFCGENLFQFVDGYSIHVHTYRAFEYDGTATETDEAEPLWFDLDEIPYDEMWEDDRLWLPLLIAGKKYHSVFIFDGDKMLDSQVDVI
ncbi:MAG: 8-oxo-dGTP diphosphatase [Xanthomonadales bacterium]|nr:8-oxo-dGTP diphosphatase [Xanthomonadales bacterium]